MLADRKWPGEILLGTRRNDDVFARWLRTLLGSIPTGKRLGDVHPPAGKIRMELVRVPVLDVQSDGAVLDV